VKKIRNYWPWRWFVYLLLIPFILLSLAFRSRLTLAAGFVTVWLLVSTLVIVFGVINIKRRRMWRRFYAGECVRCGYDLRATPDQCPECGLVPPKLKSVPFR